MRTSKTKINQIEKFIIKKAKEYRKKKEEAAAKKDADQKARDAKLRAIDLKSKKILTKTKKHEYDDDRTSFKLSIDNYATFSELREAQEYKEKEKANHQKSKSIVRKGGHEAMNMIYGDIEEEPMPKGIQPNVESREKSQKRV